MVQFKESRSPDDVQQAHVECFLLCDYARAENGKLHIVGGGWDRIIAQHLPLSYGAYLATKLVLPGELLEDPVRVRVDLLDNTGQVLGEPVLENTIESDPGPSSEEFAGKPRLVATLFMGTSIMMELTQPGRFVLRLLVNDEPVASTSFMVSSSPALQEH